MCVYSQNCGLWCRFVFSSFMIHLRSFRLSRVSPVTFGCCTTLYPPNNSFSTAFCNLQTKIWFQVPKFPLCHVPSEFCIGGLGGFGLPPAGSWTFRWKDKIPKLSILMPVFYWKFKSHCLQPQASCQLLSYSTQLTDFFWAADHNLSFVFGFFLCVCSAG